MTRTPFLDEAEARRCVEAVEKKLREGYPPRSVPGSHNKSAIRAAGDELGLSSNTFWSRMRPGGTVEGKFGLIPDWSLYQPPDPRAAEPVVDDRARGETQGEEFWRNRARSLARDLERTDHILGQVSGLIQTPINPPEWIANPEGPGHRRRAVIGCLVTDMHYGEVVDPDEILSLNSFDPDICEQRMRRYFEAVAAIGPRWASDTDLVGCIVTLGGDLVSGDIHEELRITNALTSIEQVRGAVEILTAGITLMADTFGKVFVPTVAGNHGRQTHKPTAKLYARLNYDTLVCQMVADALAGDERITFQIATGRDNSFPVFGRTVFVNHGDGMGTGGGQGFAGPLLPIVRGTKKVEAQQARAGRRPDLILHGHYHHSAQPGPVLSNGSVPGYSEYGNGLRAGIEPPQQWAFLLHEKWWLRERAEIKLEDPGPPPRLVQRVPAVMQRQP